MTYTGVESNGGAVESTSTGKVTRVLEIGYNDASNTTVYLSFMIRPNNNAGYAALELHNDVGRTVQIGYGESVGEASSDDFFVRLFDFGGFYGSLGAHNTDVNFIVAKLTLSPNDNEDRIEVWFNPTGQGLDLEAAAGPADYFLDGFSISIDRIVLDNFNSSVAWDELRLGNCWEEVVPQTSAYDSFSAASEPGAGEYDDDLSLVGQTAPAVDVAGVYEHGWTGEWLSGFGDFPEVLGAGGLSYTGVASTGGADWSGGCFQRPCRTPTRSSGHRRHVGHRLHEFPHAGSEYGRRLSCL